MRNNADGTRSPTNLFEAAAWHSHIHVQCTRCGHHAVFAPHGLWWLFHRRHWDDGFAAVAKRMRCRMGQRGCTGRGKLTVTKAAVTIRLTDPDEREWKRALTRFRC